MLAPLLVVSGATALAYEVLWARDFALLFGATAVGAAVVLAATFGGLALGAGLAGWAFARRRRASGAARDAAASVGQGLLVYGVLEIAVALSVLVYLGLRPLVAWFALGVLGRAPAAVVPIARTLLAMAVLIVPSALLGATLPAAAAALPQGDKVGAGRLYAWNTLGGALGALASAVILLPLLGVRATYLACIVLDVAIGALAIGLRARAARAVVAARVVTRVVAAPPSDAPAPRPWLALLAVAISGFVGLACEVLWMRGLSGVLSNSVYSFALVLAVVLIGIVLGAALASRLLAAAAARVALVESSLAAAAAALALGILVSRAMLATVPEVSLRLVSSLGGGDAGTHVAGLSAAAIGFAVESFLCALVIALPAVALGAILPLALSLARPAAPAWAVGPVLAANTAAAIAGSLAAAFVLLPHLGLGGGLLATAFLAAVLALVAALAGGTPTVRLLALGTGALVVANAVLAPRLDLRWRGEGAERVLFQRDGAAASVLVTEDARGRKRLRVNGQYSLGGASVLLESRQAHVPLLLHSDPHLVLSLGVGTGDTLGAVVAHPGVEADGVELVPEVLEAAAFFARENRGVLTDPRAHLRVDDARSHLLSSHQRYDVILSDLFLPWTAGAASLYSREIYAAGRARLEPGGIYAQWLPLHQLGAADLQKIVATFLDVFPHAQLWMAYHRSDTPLAVLIGSESPLRVDAANLRGRARDPELAAALRAAGFDDPVDVAPLYVAGERQLAEAARGTAPITDDRPTIEFSAPQAYFRQHALAAESLRWVIGTLDPDGAPIDGAPDASGELRRALLDAQLALVSGDRPRELGFYLTALELAPETRAARQALLGIARERLAAGDVATARVIGAALARAAPSSAEAERAAALPGVAGRAP